MSLKPKLGRDASPGSMNLLCIPLVRAQENPSKRVLKFWGMQGGKEWCGKGCWKILTNLKLTESQVGAGGAKSSEYVPKDPSGGPQLRPVPNKTSPRAEGDRKP